MIENLIRYADVDELEFDHHMSRRIGQETAYELRRSLNKHKLVDTGRLKKAIGWHRPNARGEACPAWGVPNYLD